MIPRRWLRLTAAAVAATLAVAGCGGAHKAVPPPTTVRPGGSPDPGATLSDVLGPAPANWNVLAAAGASPVLTQVLAQVWPSVFEVGPTFTPVLDKTFVTSATVTATDPQTVVYKINPKAVWSDGQPITAADFIYNWEAQSGQARFTDRGGAPFTPASTAGYDRIALVTSGGERADTVTVVFATPDPDWRALFAHLVPAHVAARVGFDRGFTDPVRDDLSGGPYLIAAAGPTGVRLVRNPRYWGPVAAVSAIELRFVANPRQVVAALAAGQVDCATFGPGGVTVAPDPADLARLRRVATLHVAEAASAAYLDLDFNEAGPLHDLALRQAISAAVDRPALLRRLEGGVQPPLAPVGNRLLAPGQPGYRDDTPAGVGTGDVRHARQVLQAAGYTLSGSTLTANGVPLRLRLVAGSDALSAAAAKAVTADLAAIGIGVSAATGPVPAGPGSWDLAVEVRQLTPWASRTAAGYVAGDPADHDGYVSAATTGLVGRLATATGRSAVALEQRIDRQVWSDRVDLPLVWVPEAVVCQSTVSNVGPNPAPDGPAYDAQTWGVRPPTS